MALPGREAAELAGLVELTLAGLVEVPARLGIFREILPERAVPAEVDLDRACDRLVVDLDLTNVVTGAITFEIPPARSTSVFRGSGFVVLLLGAGIVVFMFRFVADCSCNGTNATAPLPFTGDESLLPCGNGREDPIESAMSFVVSCDRSALGSAESSFCFALLLLRAPWWSTLRVARHNVKRSEFDMRRSSAAAQFDHICAYLTEKLDRSLQVSLPCRHTSVHRHSYGCVRASISTLV